MNTALERAETARKNQQAALAAFAVHKTEIDKLLAEIAAASADHFGVAPDEVHWGHVGDLASYVHRLRQVADAIYRRGEHAESRS